MGIVAICVIVPFGLPLLVSLDPNAPNLRNAFQPPSLSTNAPLGTDRLGRDTLTRLIFGLRPSIIVSAGAVMFAFMLGTAVGAFAGYRRGRFDIVASRLVDMLMALPTLLFALMLVAAFGAGLINVLVAVSLAFLPGFVRLARNPTLSVAAADFVVAARSVGARDRRILVLHVVPNILPAILALAVIHLGDAVLIESGLSYLGVGIQPPDASLGSMIREAANDLYRTPWLTITAGGVLLVLVLALNVIGDYLQDRAAGRR